MSDKIDATLLFYRVLGCVALFLVFAPLFSCIGWPPPQTPTVHTLAFRVCPVLTLVLGIASAHGKMNWPAVLGSILGIIEAVSFYTLMQLPD